MRLKIRSFLIVLTALMNLLLGCVVVSVCWTMIHSSSSVCWFIVVHKLYLNEWLEHNAQNGEMQYVRKVHRNWRMPTAARSEEYLNQAYGAESTKEDGICVCWTKNSFTTREYCVSQDYQPVTADNLRKWITEHDLNVQVFLHPPFMRSWVWKTTLRFLSSEFKLKRCW